MSSPVAGKSLGVKLIEALGLGDRVASIDIQIRVNSVPIIKVEYLTDEIVDDAIVSILKEYTAVENEQ